MPQTTNCDLCGSSNYTNILQQKDIIHQTSSELFTLVECNNCGLNYLNPRPNEKEITKYYPKDYNFYNKNSIILRFINFFFKIIIKFSALLFLVDLVPIRKIHEMIILRILPKMKYPYDFKSNTFFLDIGSGSGNSIHFWDDKFSINCLIKKYKNIYAIEPSAIALKKIKLSDEKKSEFLRPFSNIKFDHIRMNWSLEHVHKPSEYFKFVSQNLKKNGNFLLCIPNYDGHIYRIDKKNIEVPIHLYHFKYNNVLNYCKKNNLKIIDFKTFSYPGMYYFSSKINKNFDVFSKISTLQSKRLMEVLRYFDQMNIGNDMVFVISK